MTRPNHRACCKIVLLSADGVSVLGLEETKNYGVKRTNRKRGEINDKKGEFLTAYNKHTRQKWLKREYFTALGSMHRKGGSQGTGVRGGGGRGDLISASPVPHLGVVTCLWPWAQTAQA